MLRWIASFPKSGNTWLRLFLSSLDGGGEEPDMITLRALPQPAGDRPTFDNLTGLPSVCLPDSVIENLKPGAYRTMAEGLTSPLYLKTHDIFGRTPDGRWMAPPDVTGPSVYLVRDPRDVAISYAHHSGQSVDWAIGEMAAADHRASDDPNRPGAHLPHIIGGWSEHVESWLDAPIPLLLVRYEQMLAAPHAEFTRVARHLGLPTDPALIARCVEACDFARLQERERTSGFAETVARGRPFFRQGVAGGWARVLTQAQIDRITADHGAVMRRMGYL